MNGLVARGVLEVRLMERRLVQPDTTRRLRQTLDTAWSALAGRELVGVEERVVVGVGKGIADGHASVQLAVDLRPRECVEDLVDALRPRHEVEGTCRAGLDAAGKAFALAASFSRNTIHVCFVPITSTLATSQIDGSKVASASPRCSSSSGASSDFLRNVAR